MAIVEAGIRSQLFTELPERALLGDPGVGLRRIREHEPVVMGAEARRGHRFVHRLEPGEDPRAALVVDRHDHRRAGGQPRRHRPGSTRAQQRGEADERAGEGERDPGEVQDEQHQQQVLQPRRPAGDRDHLVHLPRAVGREQEGAAEHEQPGGQRPAPAAPGGLGRRAQVLHRHGERRLRGHRGGGRPRLGELFGERLGELFGDDRGDWGSL
jgi:hypothetical protein